MLFKFSSVAKIVSLINLNGDSSSPTYNKKKVANFHKQATSQMGNPFFRLTETKIKLFFLNLLHLSYKSCIFRRKNG